MIHIVAHRFDRVEAVLVEDVGAAGGGAAPRIDHREQDDVVALVGGGHEVAPLVDPVGNARVVEDPPDVVRKMIGDELPHHVIDVDRGDALP